MKATLIARLKQQKIRFKNWAKLLGSGLITGAADDDPSGIATYTQTGAKFGYSQLWTAVYMLPLMIVVQETCARIGLVQGKGIAAVIKEYYSKRVLYFIVGTVLVANTINIGADIGAMASAAALIIPLPFAVLALAFTSVTLLLEIFTTYKTYSRILKWLALSLLAYPLTLIIVKQPWLTLLKASFIPSFSFNFEYIFIIIGVLGTTISPYMFFWQASQEVEEEKSKRLLRNGKPLVTKRLLHNMRIDNATGMIMSELTTWCIIVVAATVLHRSGNTDIKDAADAARALEPLVRSFPNSGYIAKLIFSTGIIGLGLLAIPVLSGSAAYAISETLDWKTGLNLKFKKAHGFYGVITIATLIGLMINFIGIDPIKALIYAAVLNGIAAVPLLFIIARISSSELIMGKYKSSKTANIIVWITFGAMALAIIGMIVSSVNN